MTHARPRIKQGVLLMYGLLFAAFAKVAYVVLFF